MPTDAAMEAFPDGEWTNPGIQAACREAFDQGQEHALLAAWKDVGTRHSSPYLNRIFSDRVENVRNARMH